MITGSYVPVYSLPPRTPFGDDAAESGKRLAIFGLAIAAALIGAFYLVGKVDQHAGFRRNGRWSKKYKDSLPDSAFLYVEGTPGSGRSRPLSRRRLPYKSRSGKVSVPHVRAALSRLSRTQIPARAKPAIRRKAERLLQRSRAR